MSGPPFGTYRPSRRKEFFRRLAAHLPYTYLGRKIASALLGPAGGRESSAYDVTVFGTQNARLYPYDNISEKRVYLTPHHWDLAERTFLANYIKSHTDDHVTFVDVGANAGLYTLFVRSVAQAAGKTARALCIEPDPIMRERLTFNLSASQALDDVHISPFAAAAQSGVIGFQPSEHNRGMSRLDPNGVEKVNTHPLLRIIKDSQMPSIDILKIDIEGHEDEVLSAFFADTPSNLKPNILQTEISHNSNVTGLILEAGYRLVLRNSLNAVFIRSKINEQTD